MNADDKSGVESPLQSEQKAKRERSSLCKILPTDRIAFDKQVKILQAFAAVYESNGGKPVSSEQAGGTLTPTFSASTLNVAVPFFTDIALLTRNQGDFIPSPELVAYNQAIRLSASEAKRKLRPLFENTWFCRLLAPRLQLNPQPVNECVGMLAVEAKAEKEHLPRIGPLIDFLELAGIVTISGGIVSFASSIGELPPLDAGKSPLNQEFKPPQDESVHSYVLPLPNKRKVVVEAPLNITKAEILRLQKWLEFTLLLDWKEDVGT